MSYIQFSLDEGPLEISLCEMFQSSSNHLELESIAQDSGTLETLESDVWICQYRNLGFTWSEIDPVECNLMCIYGHDSVRLILDTDGHPRS